MSVERPDVPSRPWRLRFHERRPLLALGDFLAASISLVLALYAWSLGERFLGFSVEFVQRRVPWWFWFMPLIWLLLLIELYDLHRASRWRATVKGVATAAGIGFVVYLILFFYYANSPRSLLPRRGVATFLIAATLLTLAWRWFYIRIFTLPQFMRRALIVGGGNAGTLMIEVYKAISPPPFVLVGVVDDDPEKQGKSILGIPVLGTSETLLKLVKEHEISDIIVAISGALNSNMFQALLTAQESGVEIIRMPKMYERLLGRVPIRILEADWILRSFVDETSVSVFDELLKRLFDILGGIVGMAIFLATFPFIALAIVIDDGLPIFYTQIRLGRMARPYPLIKYRTMRRDAESDGKPRWAQENDRRATRVGRFLRKSHLDELPQFINVLRGEMSLVGPRAERLELVEYFEKRVPFYRARLLVKPGLTGWAQVNYGYAASIEETTVKLEYDLYYIKNRSLLIDILILLRTPSTVLGLKGR
ncbi:MAG: sugar transferase [Anaerolineales bacterium]|nr:sugar transferase [Anaerolineales bacterium]MDW8160563.1 sugar transferase [Anaerolineales bacterium]